MDTELVVAGRCVFAGDAAERGYDLAAVGDLGTGNTSTAAALIAEGFDAGIWLTGAPESPAKCWNTSQRVIVEVEARADGDMASFSSAGAY